MSYQISHPDDLSPLETQLAADISIDEPWALLETFADLTRVSGTADEETAAEYIIDRLQAFDVDTRRYDPELYISQPHDASVTVTNHDVTPDPVKTIAFAASTTVSGPVEYVGSPGESTLGTVDDRDIGHVPYEDVDDLTGTIALTAAGSLSIRATRLLEAKGAAGVIAIHQHDEEPHDGIATPIWGGAPPYEDRDQIPDIPIVNVTRPDGATLKQLAESPDGLEVELSTDLTEDWFECPLVEARIDAGTDTDDFVLLHGHYDSWGVGITDNATGDATLLELARVFEAYADRLDRNLRICWWPAHSTGRYAGSTWYADEFAHDLANHCVAHVNCDSPGAKDSTEYVDMSCWTPETHDLVGNTIEAVADAPYEEHHPHRAGDYSFDNLGISGFFMLSSNIPESVRDERGYHAVGGCGGNSDAWHLSTDTLDKAGKDELLRDMTVYGVSVLRVLTADVLPFDHRRTVQTIRDQVETYDDIAGDDFDFTPTLDALEALDETLAAFDTAVGAGDIPATEANAAIKQVSRTLTRLNLVTDGQFEQDPALSRDPVPRYAPVEQFHRIEDPDERRFLAVQLDREQTSVTYDLDQLCTKIPAAPSS